MKYAIFGDLHGTELNGLEKVLAFQNVDVLICLGDFDQTKTIHQFRDLEKKYLSAEKLVIKVPGNHDHAILNDLRMASEVLKRQGKTRFELYYELISDPVAKEYINKLVNSQDQYAIFLDKDKFGKDYPTIIIHGACDGDLSSYPGCPEKIKDLWFRLKTENDHRKNFEVMDKKGYKVMIRGHDHEPSYTYCDPEKGIVTRIPESGSVYLLLKHRKHTINPGALLDGWFATIDTRSLNFPMLEYHKL
ncbi:MAG: metallophosphoesterase family protein [Candidatus Nanoarchaeia archaeon]